MTKHRPYRLNKIGARQLRSNVSGPRRPAVVPGPEFATIRLVVRQPLRLILLGGLALLLAGLFHPTTAKAACPFASDCCSVSASHEKPAQAQTSAPDHCPFKGSQTDQCCCACPLTLSLIDWPSAPFVFVEGCSSIFSLPEPTLLTRSDRPPYPPPRAQV